MRAAFKYLYLHQHCKCQPY